MPTADGRVALKPINRVFNTVSRLADDVLPDLTV
tara:strand:- start:399 stop:500 length:102 start_codon:yes stop_codon:yes gene_type:complete